MADRNYPVRHNKTQAVIVLSDASLVGPDGGGEYTIGNTAMVAGQQVWADTGGALTTTPPAGSAGNYKRQFMFMGG